MMKDSQELPMRNVLAVLEAQLESPEIPGELVEWLQETAEAASKLAPTIRVQIENRHRELIEAIVEQDEGLLARAERLKIEDHTILDEAERFDRMISSVSEHIDRLEPDESRANHAVQKIVSEGLELVIRIRKQEAAIGAWFMEAFDRDRGVAD